MATVRKLSGDRKKPWQLAFTAPGGTRTTEHFYTQKAALRRMTEVQHEIDRGEYGPDPNMTYGALLDEFMADCQRRQDIGDIAGNTLQTWRINIENHMRPALGHIKLRKLSAPVCQRVINDVSHFKSVPRMVKKILSVSLKFAARRNYTTFGNIANVMAGLQMPKRRKAPARIPNLEQLHTFLKVLLWSKPVTKGQGGGIGRCQSLQTHENRIGIFLFLITTGARVSEASGLLWENVDFTRGKIHIRHAHNRFDGLKGTKSGETPSHDLHPALRLALERIWERQGRPDAGYVFQTLKGKPILPLMIHKSYLMPAMRDAGLVDENDKPFFAHHGFRHAFVSLEHRRGTQPLKISKKVGHRNPSETLNTYSHVFEDEDGGGDETFAAIERLLSPRKPLEIGQKLALSDDSGCDQDATNPPQTLINSQ
jgi:integrase